MNIILEEALALHVHVTLLSKRSFIDKRCGKCEWQPINKTTATAHHYTFNVVPIPAEANFVMDNIKKQRNNRNLGPRAKVQPNSIPSIMLLTFSFWTRDHNVQNKIAVFWPQAAATAAGI